MSINQSDRARDFQVLDPCLLGRPVHLLPAFATRLAEALGVAMASPGGRRYWGAFRLESLAFERAPDDRALRWLGVNGPYGLAAVAFERSLLLDLLEGRYARRTPGPQAASNAAPQRDAGLERVTATEERLAATLAQQVAQLLDDQVTQGLVAAGAVQAPAVPAGAHLKKAGASIVPAGAPGKAGWVIRAVLRAQYGRRDTDDPSVAAPQGRVWIAPDHGLMAHVLQGLMAERNGMRGAVRMARDPLATHLQVKLEGRLVSKEVTLATLFGLKVGDVIPVSVGRADVLLDDSRLFTAAVAEHKGKLCLTSFEDAE